jgi:hypothetical protein
MKLLPSEYPHVADRPTDSRQRPWSPGEDEAKVERQMDFRISVKQASSEAWESVLQSVVDGKHADQDASGDKPRRNFDRQLGGVVPQGRSTP